MYIRNRNSPSDRGDIENLLLKEGEETKKGVVLTWTRVRDVVLPLAVVVVLVTLYSGGSSMNLLLNRSNSTTTVTTKVTKQSNIVIANVTKQEPSSSPVLHKSLVTEQLLARLGKVRFDLEVHPRDTYNCEDFDDMRRPIPDERVFTVLRDSYRAVAGPYSTIGPNINGNSSIKVPFEIRQTRKRGRGVFAMADIPVATLIWDGSESQAHFRSELDWYKYLWLVDKLDEDWVCDALEWSFIKDDIYIAEVDAAGMFNGFAKSNIVYMDNKKKMFAARNISAGKEIIDQYSGTSWV